MPSTLSGVSSEFGTGSFPGTPSGHLSWFVRGGSTAPVGGAYTVGWVPSHYHNEGVSTSVSGLRLSQFIGTYKDYRTTVGVGNSGGGYFVGGYGFSTSQNGTYGSVTNTRQGTDRTSLAYADLAALYEVGYFNGFFTVWYLIYETYGYLVGSPPQHFRSVTVNGSNFNYADSTNPSGNYDGTWNVSTWSWITSPSARVFPTSGTWSVQIEYGGI